MGINKEKVIQMLSYKCPKQGRDKDYYRYNILTAIMWTGTFDHLQRLIAVIGKQAFIDNVFNLDTYNEDLMNWAMYRKNMKVIEYILSFDQIKTKYTSDNNELHHLCRTLNEYIEYKEAVKYIVDTLELTEAKLTELNEFRAIDIEKIIPFTK